jgi:deazaflavin-dependent oxidoreductase (nitroreductase family)
MLDGMAPPGSPTGVAARLAGVAGRATCRLTHQGRKTGRPHEVTIWFLVDGEKVYLTTMNMQRQWTRNVQANPDVVLRVGDERFAGRAEVVADAAGMARAVELLRRKYWLARPYLWLKGRPDGAFRVRVRAGAPAPGTP